MSYTPGPVEHLVTAHRGKEFDDALDALAPVCQTCDGAGYVDSPNNWPCSTCNGLGRVLSLVRLADSAPDLYEALKALLPVAIEAAEQAADEYGSSPHPDTLALFSAARAALAKVEEEK